MSRAPSPSRGAPRQSCRPPPPPPRRLPAPLVNRLPTSTGKVTLEFLLKEFVAAAELPPLERHLTWFGALGPGAGAPEIVPEVACRLTGAPEGDPLNPILRLLPRKHTP